MKKHTNDFTFECSCKKAIRPLVFFDGSIWCPSCKKNLFWELNQKEVTKSTAKADGSFSVSQELFAKYLCSEQKRSEESLAALRNAIAYCRRAAYALNPYALLNLGYYYYLGYDESVRTEVGRSFAKMCFELAEKHAPQGDDVFSELLKNNKNALKEAPHKSELSDSTYLKALITRMQLSEKAIAPRLGVFSIDKTVLKDNEKKEELLKNLKKLYALANVYTFITDKDGNMTLPKVKSAKEIENDVNKCFSNSNQKDRNDNIVWIAYKRKGLPPKAFRGKLMRYFGKEEIDEKDEKEIKDNLSIIRQVAAHKANKGVDFSDQDIWICTFTDKLHTVYDIDTTDENSPFDRLSKVYRKIMNFSK